MSEYNIINGQELLHICHEKGLTISEVGMNLEVERGEMTRQQIYEEMRLNLQVMRESIREGLEEQQTSVTGLMGLDADKLNAFTESAIMGRELTRIVASSMAVTEVNASMGRIVAAPHRRCQRHPARHHHLLWGHARLDRGADGFRPF